MLKEGDIVQLKTGGVDMILTYFTVCQEYAVCKWQDHSGNKLDEVYPLVALIKVEL
jgi:uncharacterized protein YodC (DUF2158 family)